MPQLYARAVPDARKKMQSRAFSFAGGRTVSGPPQSGLGGVGAAVDRAVSGGAAQPWGRVGEAPRPLPSRAGASVGIPPKIFADPE